MKKIFSILSILSIVFLVSSCKNEKSLQSYLVEKSGKEGYFTGDIPVSSVITPKSDVSDDVKETLKSVKKLNVVFLQKTKDNDSEYEAEKTKLNEIFKDNDTYKSLGRMKMKGKLFKLYLF